ncbi:CtsR family transcriptional regulator [Tissierella sp. MSJ-40]|uniref:Transcriptional regulator CtsR n=1 Tax=Tissierella simiarum TaxID=2841534 RepID=A0ABS6E754_9FIRM|nr:CtsR family transcriptional regulator [Tissierella simiarum]MBU5438686.1 CtsR family transcriptional regulator [Tissierella simiarum]
MTGLSNIIEQFIKEMLEETENGIVEIQRNELAEYFECAPSQINYVLTTRFTPYKGYYIESRRGGGGYIKIVKVSIDEYEDINHIIVNTIGNSITKNKAYHIIEGLIEENIITKREGELMKSALGDRSLSANTTDRNQLRADILKNMLLILVK